MLYTQQDDSKFTTAELTTPLLLQCNICSTQQLEYKEMQLKSLKYIFSNYNLKQYTIRKHSKPRKYQFMCPIINDRLSRNSWKTNTHTHPFNGPLSGTTQVSRYEKGKTNLDFTEAKDSE